MAVGDTVADARISARRRAPREIQTQRTTRTPGPDARLVAAIAGSEGGCMRGSSGCSVWGEPCRGCGSLRRAVPITRVAGSELCQLEC